METRQFNIFVEGHDDHDLVLALVRQLKTVRPHPTKPEQPQQRDGRTTYLEMVPTGEIILIASIGGWNKLGKKEAFFLREARDFGGRTLVVFDADEDTSAYESGGPVRRREAILNKLLAFDPDPAIFLFPDSTHPGDLETLLLQLTSPAHQRVMDCYDAYEQCLQQFVDATGQPCYDAPSKKRRIYDYVNVMPLKGKEWERHHEKGGQKIFENSDLWNLDAPAIQPLRAFLDLHIR